MTNISKNRIVELMLQFIPVNQRGARRRICLITVIQFILHKLKTGCQWRFLYADIEGVRPAFCWQTVYRYFRLWVQSGAWEQLFYTLRNNNLNQTQLSVLNLDGTQRLYFRMPPLRGLVVLFLLYFLLTCRPAGALLLTFRPAGALLLTFRPAGALCGGL
jgi:transposase